ncbi:glycosyltransferase family 4 protein [Pendulispora rubella]|uniref:Glycosyltransferase family 4 protein n=1 Tax=Pendulispora rubella TaxID=2741070 RepID=A0ABZ2KZA4_9BACT
MPTGLASSPPHVTRVAIVTTSYPRDDDDASGHFVRAEVDQLRRAGATVEVFVPRGPAFGWPGVAARLRERPWRATGVPFEMARMARALRAAGRFDRTIAHFVVPSALLALSAKHRGGLELVSHGGDVRLLVALPGAVRRYAVRAMLQHAQLWRFPSEALLGDLASALGHEERRALGTIARVVPPPFEMPEIPARGSQGPRNLPASPPPCSILWVCAARLIPSKRIDRAIEHAAAHGARLVVVGDGPEQARLQRLARARGADVHFVGRKPRSETLAWIASADALVHASEAEGLSTVVREAEALGTPVIDLSFTPIICQGGT